jgi:hypothetical protein
MNETVETFYALLTDAIITIHFPSDAAIPFAPFNSKKSLEAYDPPQIPVNFL